MDQFITAFALGNGAILTNVCLLPLYPGLVAFLAGNAQQDGNRQGANLWLGAMVLLGVMSLMLLVGVLFFVLRQSVSLNNLFPVLLPLIYGVVLVLGIAMLAGFNPFARLSVGQIPLFRNPYLSAYSYGLFLGPMTLPCTGPVIIAAVGVGALGGTGELLNQLLFFAAFGLGFGWPLIVLPLLANAAQRRFTGWLTQHHMLLTRVSGLLLIAIGVYGYVVEVFRLV